jgi:hypothetical protein
MMHIDYFMQILSYPPMADNELYENKRDIRKASDGRWCVGYFFNQHYWDFQKELLAVQYRLFR